MGIHEVTNSTSVRATNVLTAHVDFVPRRCWNRSEKKTSFNFSMTPSKSENPFWFSFTSQIKYSPVVNYVSSKVPYWDYITLKRYSNKYQEHRYNTMINLVLIWSLEKPLRSLKRRINPHESWNSKILRGQRNWNSRKISSSFKTK